jgi:cytochrome c1
MVAWIEHPHQIEPKTVMPEMGLSDQESRDIAAYLYTQHTAD